VRPQPIPASLLLLSLALLSFPAIANAGVKVFDSPDHTLELGMRVQPRIEYEMVPTGASSSEARRDFLIRRARLKANGKMLGVAYCFEWKIDGTDQFGATPAAAVENAWFQYPLTKALELRVGLYDQPFSRDRLTSDSRQLAVDRGAVSNVPDALGLADNAVGFHFYGKTKDLKFQYAIGLYDNRFIPANRQDLPMVVGRMEVNLGSTKDVYQDAHFGEDRWYSFGVNGSYHSSLENAAGVDDSTHAAAGVDGMVDLPFGKRRLLVRGEMNAIRTEWIGVNQENNTTVKMIEAGVLFRQVFQPFIRFDQVRGNNWVGGGRRDITYVGANFYQRGHSLKIQGDVRMQSGTTDAVDGVRLQSQIDF